MRYTRMSAESRIEKATKALSGELEPGEVVRAALVGAPIGNPKDTSTKVVRGGFGQIGDAATIWVKGNRMVAVTDRHVYVVRTAQLQAWKPKETLAKHPLGEVDVTAQPTSIVVGDHHVGVTQFGAKKQMDELVAAAGSPTG